MEQELTREALIEEIKKLKLRVHDLESLSGSLVAHMPGAVYRRVNDLRLTLVFLSDAIYDITGYPAKDFIDNVVRDYLSIVHPEDQTLVSQHVHESHLSFALEYRIIHADGSVRWVSERGIGIKGGNNAIEFIDGVIFDITEHRKAEEALRESEQKYKTLYNSSKEGIAIMSPEKGFVDVNPTMVKLYGCQSEQELLGKQLYNFAPQYQVDGVLSTVKNKQIVDTSIYEDSFFSEWKARRVDGQEFFATILFTPMVFHGEMMLQVIVRDVTARRTMEEKLRESERRFRESLEHVRLIVLQLDLQGKITFCNDYFLKLVGYQKEEVLGGSWFNLFIPEADRNHIQTLFQNVLGQGNTHHEAENFIMTKQKEQRLIHWNNTVLYNADNVVIGVNSLGEDITEREKLRKELLQKVEDLERFNLFVVDREVKMVELKQKVKELQARIADLEKAGSK